MVGSFVGFGLITVFGGAEALSVNVWVLLLVMFLCAMLAGGLLGVMIERFAYRRLRNAPRIAPLITALGVSFFLENTAQLVLGAQYQSYNSYGWHNGSLWTSGFTLPAGVHVGLPQVIAVVGAVVLMVLLTLFVRGTQLGKAMRATSFDREAASMMGIDVDRVIVATFFIGSALAGAAGVFNGLVYQQVWPYMGFQAGSTRSSPPSSAGSATCPGAVVGGLVIGLAQSFSIGYISSTFSDAIVFAVLIVVMVLRPSGLLGRAAVQKV